MNPLGPGRIFWEVFPGSRGGGKKRPMVIVSRVVDILRSGKVIAVVCSTDFDADDILPKEIPVPNSTDGRSPTRLREPTVAVCDWTTTFLAEEIRETEGIVPTNILREICRAAGITYVSER